MTALTPPPDNYFRCLVLALFATWILVLAVGFAAFTALVWLSIQVLRWLGWL